MLDASPAHIVRGSRKEHHVCPQCRLQLTVEHDGKGATVSYDMESWARLCPCSSADGPLACPSATRRLWAWLSSAV